MENKNEGLVKSESNQLGFVEQSLQSLEKALVYAKGLVDSKMLPKHYYDDNGAPKANAAQSALLVIQMGREIGLSTLQSIQQIVPVQGILSLKGDGAKALIRGSGKVKEWKEESFGEGDDYGFRITSTRRDTGETLSTTFTVEDAKRAGLWITDKMAQENPKLKYSAWYKYGKSRMLKYRCLGFHARDMYSDVLQGVMTLEEAEDYNVDNTKYVTEGIVVDITKGDTTEQSNTVVAETLQKKDEKKKKLAGSTIPKVDLSQQQQETPATPVEVSTPTEAQPGIDIQKYEAHLKSLTPKELGQAFVELNSKGILPFNVEQWLKMGGSKIPKDLIVVMVAAQKGKQELDSVLKAMKLSNIEDAKLARGLDEQLEIMDKLDAAGIDCDMLASSLNFANKEEMLAFGDKEQILNVIPS